MPAQLLLLNDLLWMASMPIIARVYSAYATAFHSTLTWILLAQQQSSCTSVRDEQHMCTPAQLNWDKAAHHQISCSFLVTMVWRFSNWMQVPVH